MVSLPPVNAAEHQLDISAAALSCEKSPTVYSYLSKSPMRADLAGSTPKPANPPPKPRFPKRGIRGILPKKLDL